MNGFYIPSWILLFVYYIKKEKKILTSKLESTPYFYLVSQINHSNLSRITKKLIKLKNSFIIYNKK